MKVDVNEARAEFAVHKKSLFESGALREIYVGRRATVYSLADVGYGIVIFVDKPGEGNAYHVLFCVLDEVRAYIENDDILYDMTMHKADVTNDMFIFNDRFDKRLEELNQRRIQTGFTRIDREAEEKMLASIRRKRKFPFFRR